MQLLPLAARLAAERGSTPGRGLGERVCGFGGDALVVSSAGTTSFDHPVFASICSILKCLAKLLE